MRGSNSIQIADMELNEYTNNSDDFNKDCEGLVLITTFWDNEGDEYSIIKEKNNLFIPIDEYSNVNNLIRVGTMYQNDMEVIKTPVYIESTQNNIWIESYGYYVTCDELHNKYLQGKELTFTL